MTEAEWLDERTNPQRMVLALLQDTSAARTKVGRRKLRLYACGCCRLIWPHLDPRLRGAVEAAERFADGELTARELDKARRRADDGKGRSFSPEFPCAQTDTAVAMAVHTTDPKPSWAASNMTCYPLSLAGYRGAEAEAEALVRALLRDIFGNPYRPVGIDRAWRTSTAVALAKQMYETHDFSAMPILADALQDAGCEDESTLGHCRDPKQLHARGCWVVDLVFGKA